MNLRKIFMLLFLSICLLFSSTAYAKGEGGGKNSSEDGALTLSSSTPANNEHNVKLPVQINLTFSNNVVNMNVKDENLKCFSLVSSDGTNIPIEVKMADDQVQPDKKREVILVPKQDLKLNTEYTVTISSALKSKNGETLGKDMKVTFDTGKPAGSNTVTIVIIAAIAVVAAGFILRRKGKK